MAEQHVTEEEVRWLIEGDLRPERRRALIAHLLAGCSECLRRAASLAPFLDPPDVEDEVAEPAPAEPSAAEAAAYDAVILRCGQAVSALVPRFQEEARQREAFLARVGDGRALSIDAILRAAAELEMPTRPLVDALLALSFAERARHPGRMLALATVGANLAANLHLSSDAALYSPQEAADLAARAWGELGNAHRRNDRFAATEEALVRAEAARAAGSGDLLLRARLLDLEASLRTDQRRFAEAYRLLDQVYEIYDEIGERHLAGRALISLGEGLFYDGDLEQAAGLLRRGLSRLEPDGDPQLVATARHFLLVTLAAGGQYTEAAELLLRSGLREALPEPLNRLKVRWLEARIYAGLGRRGRAEGAFREILAEFTAMGAEYEAALVRLELAGVLLNASMGSEEVERQAAEAYKTFESLDVGPEALRAVGYLRKACRGRQATAALVREVVLFLERLEARPHLRFGD
jgi:tetratricopeptide (TPR) repeat protein